MAFIIKNVRSKYSLETIASALRAILFQSRFSAQIVNEYKRIRIAEVRLLEAKDYCGNHPLPCPFRPGVERPHKHMKYLEGADWVAFNDMVNDVLDGLHVEADAGSSLVTIRKGAERCTYYDSYPLGNGIDNEWVRDSGCYENRMGEQTERSGYPEGTPGIPEWRKEQESATIMA